MPSNSATSFSRAAAPVDAPALAASLERFLLENPRACVVEDGSVLFDMAAACWSLDASSGRCMLQLWDEERNLQRTVLSVQERRDALRIEVKRFGQTRPQILRLVPERDQRTPAARETARRQFAQMLARGCARWFPELRLRETFIAADLEHSFGPAYVRAILERAQTVWAVVAVNGDESQSAIDGILSIGVLWLEQCRAHAGGLRLVEGIKVIVPAGMSATVRERFPWLRTAAAKWELWELDQPREELTQAAAAEPGNLAVELAFAFDPQAVQIRFAAPVERVLALLTPAARERVELLPRSATELSFRLHGLEFARVRHGVSATSFSREDRITFGAGANETPLNEETEPLLRELVTRLFASRQLHGSIRDPLFRMQPERWLEAELRRDLAEIEPALRREPVYTQVPAIASADRGMLDLLGVTRDGRLAVLELKAGEDMHMPFQGLDYWIRVRALHAAGAFVRAGYFPGIVLSPEPPLLYFIVPALRVHSTVDTLLRHISPEVEWKLLALDEKWRLRRRVIFRKSGGGEKPWARVIAGDS